jgi:hypothetical protein
MNREYLLYQAMSEEQLATLLAKLKDDAALRDKLQGAADPGCGCSPGEGGRV